MDISNKQEHRIARQAALVDALAKIKQRIADLKVEEDDLKDALIALGEPVLEGTAHRCAVSLCEGRTTIDWQTIARKFEPSRQLIAAHTSQGEAYYNVRLYARKTS